MNKYFYDPIVGIGLEYEVKNHGFSMEFPGTWIEWRPIGFHGYAAMLDGFKVKRNFDLELEDQLKEIFVDEFKFSQFITVTKRDLEDYLEIPVYYHYAPKQYELMAWETDAGHMFQILKKMFKINGKYIEIPMALVLGHNIRPEDIATIKEEAKVILNRLRKEVK